MKKVLKTSFLVVFLFLGLFLTPFLTSNISSEKETNSIRSSAPLGYTIHIDGNWSQTAIDYTWCTGGGIITNPYVIQDIEIDANGEYGILIGNTTDYFRIENVTIYNAGTTAGNSSLVLDNVDNGHLLSNDFSNNNYYGVCFKDCNDFVIEYNTIEDNGHTGIYSYRTGFLRNSNFKIRHNFIQGNTQNGIRFSYTDWCDVWNNTFSGIGGQSNGIYVYHSNDNTIRENSFSYHSSYAVYLSVDDRSNVTHNEITNNGNGIIAFLSDSSEFFYNNITDNSGNGIYSTAGDNLWIEGNRLINNQRAFRVGINSDYNTLTENIIQDSTAYGVYIPYDSDHDNTNFKFYKNSFISNAIQALDNSIDTSWNNSEYGNYWDTYTGSDTTGDGIGEAPYIYSSNVTDYRPIMVANFSLLEDNDGDGLIDYSEINGIQNIDFGNEATNPYHPDSDLDGLNDGEEVLGTGNTYDGNPTNPNDEDTDGDGLNDIMEINGSANTYNGTPINPNDADTDGDGLDDDEEISGSANTYDGTPTNPNDGDMDGDGLSDGEECTGSGNAYDGTPTDPNEVDTDSDGLSDGEECTGSGNAYDGTPTNPNDADTDGDGLDDDEEISGSANTYDGTPTNPNEADTDGDGFDDDEEISGSANTYNGLPLDPNNFDSDGDGFDDSVELDLNCNPRNTWEYPKPDLIILSNHSLDGKVISFTIKNVGIWKAYGVVVIVSINSESLTMYDNSLTGFELEVNETKEIRILKAEYRRDLTQGENYFLSIYVDPMGVVNETNEGNNSEENILYNHNISAMGLTSVQSALIIAGSAIVLVAAVVASYLVLKQKKQKKEFRPLQLMVLEKFGSTLLYSHKFTKNNNQKEQVQEIVEKVESDESEDDDMKEKATTKDKKKARKKSSKKATKEEPEKEIDEILAAGAFSGIQSLLKSILQTEKGINEISHGEYTIYFNYGEKIICVMIAYGKFHQILSTLKLFSASFEENFQNEIAEFDGRVDIFSRANLIAEKYFPG